MFALVQSSNLKGCTTLMGIVQHVRLLFETDIAVCLQGNLSSVVIFIRITHQHMASSYEKFDYISTRLIHNLARQELKVYSKRHWYQAVIPHTLFFFFVVSEALAVSKNHSILSVIRNDFRYSQKYRCLRFLRKNFCYPFYLARKFQRLLLLLLFFIII